MTEIIEVGFHFEGQYTQAWLYSMFGAQWMIWKLECDGIELSHTPELCNAAIEALKQAEAPG